MICLVDICGMEMMISHEYLDPYLDFQLGLEISLPPPIPFMYSIYILKRLDFQVSGGSVPTGFLGAVKQTLFSCVVPVSF